ncbi:MAG TPA: hypothetical protein VIO38_08920 [Rariglobus sp.]
MTESAFITEALDAIRAAHDVEALDRTYAARITALINDGGTLDDAKVLADAWTSRRLALLGRDMGGTR